MCKKIKEKRNKEKLDEKRNKESIVHMQIVFVF